MAESNTIHVVVRYEYDRSVCTAVRYRYRVAAAGVSSKYEHQLLTVVSLSALAADLISRASFNHLRSGGNERRGRRRGGD